MKLQSFDSYHCIFLQEDVNLHSHGFLENIIEKMAKNVGLQKDDR